MTQTIFGQGLGVHGSSLGLGQYGPKGVAALGQGSVSVYVNAVNGNLIFKQADGFLADAGFGLNIFQTYNSFGEGMSAWCFNVNARLDLSGVPNQTGSQVTRIDEDGHRTLYQFDVNKKVYLAVDGSTEQLTFNNHEWIYRKDCQKTQYHYSERGVLTSIMDADGHHMQFHYDNGQLSQITDTSKRQNIIWSFQDGLLRDITTKSDGEIIHHIHYDYDANKRLHQMTRDLGNGQYYWINYDYVGDSNRIASLSQSDGVCLHIDYDASGRVKRLIDGEGRISLYEYGLGQTTLTNALGESWTYYYDEQSRLIGIDGPASYHIRYHYDGTHLSMVTEGSQIWKFVYNEAGDCILLQEPSGRLIRRTYDVEHRLLQESIETSFDGANTPQSSATTHYIYDELGHLCFSVTMNGCVTEYQYDVLGNLINKRSFLTASFKAHNKALLTTEELIAWCAAQNQAAISLTEYRYDWRGQLIEETQFKTVDARGQGVQADALCTRFAYNAAGRLIEKSTPHEGQWATTHYIYDDLGRLTQTTDAHHTIQRFEYDDLHHRIIETNAEGLQTIKVYDKSGLLLSSQCMMTNRSYGQSRYQYDAAGRLTAETGVDKVTTYSFYDAQGRLKALVGAKGLVTEYTYTAEGLLIQTLTYETLVHTEGWLELMPDYVLIKPKFGSNDRLSRVIYNEHHQMAYRIDGGGAVIEYQYDGLGQLTLARSCARRLNASDATLGLTFDEIHPIHDAKDRVISYYYDSNGQLIATINGEGYATEYRYSLQGYVIEIRSYFNPVTQARLGDWLHDAPAPHVKYDTRIRSLYDARGLKVADIDAEGYVTEYCYDESGLLHERIAYQYALPRDVVIDANMSFSIIKPPAGPNDHHSVYSYNDLGQLATEQSSVSLVRYVYDTLGQLVSKTESDANLRQTRQTRYRYDALGHVTQSLNAIGAVLLAEGVISDDEANQIWEKHSTSFIYNDAGLLISKTDASGLTTQYLYDEAQQLCYSITHDGAVTQTTYNAFGDVQSIRRYSAFLSPHRDSWSYAALQDNLNLLRNEKADEITYYEYNTIGQLSTKKLGDQVLCTHEYDAFGAVEKTTQFIDKIHTTDTLFQYDRRGLLVDETDDARGFSRHIRTGYDAFGRVIEHTDGMSHTTSYTLNHRGDITGISNASGARKSIGYDAFGRVSYETDYSDTMIISTYQYDDTHNSFILTRPGGRKIITQLNAWGDSVSVVNADGRSTTYTYNELGQLIQVDGPEGACAHYHFDEKGRLVWQEDAAGKVIEFTYDASGHILSQIIDPTGLKQSTFYAYDACGRQIKVIGANGIQTEYTYNQQGHLDAVCIDPQGLHLFTEYSYDNRGLLIQQTCHNPDGLSQVTHWEWDNLGRKIAEIKDPKGLNLITRYGYDAANNLTSVLDANGHRTHYIYDELNQCHYHIDARNRVTEYQYSRDGHKTCTIVYAIPITELPDYAESILKTVLVVDANHDQYQFQDFDLCGQLIVSYDARGFATSYNYDVNGNMVASRRYAVAVSLDALKQGRRILPSVEESRVTYYAYDANNRMRYQNNTSGYVTEFCYDATDHIIETIRYKHPITYQHNEAYTYEEMMQRCIKTPEEDVITRYFYDKAGQLIQTINPEGGAATYTYDALGHMISQTLHAQKVSSKAPYDIISSVNDRTTHYVYDANGRERYRVSASGHVIERRYDAVGNVTAELKYEVPVSPADYQEAQLKAILSATKNETDYQYDALGRLLSATNANQATTSYAYDGQGNVLEKTEANCAVWHYRYDAMNHLIETKSPKMQLMIQGGHIERSVITIMAYDSFGNLITKIRDAEGIQLTEYYEFDACNQKIKTLYPNRAVNAADNQSSTDRQEIIKTLDEVSCYNAFGEVVATRDRAGYWAYTTYNTEGKVCHQINTERGITHFSYDAYGRLSMMTRFANRISLYGEESHILSDSLVNTLCTESLYDRHEYYEYDKNGLLIETRHDAVRMYDSKNKHYTSQYAPTMRFSYNAFGELVTRFQQVTDMQWANTYYYYEAEGQKIAEVDAAGYVTTYAYTGLGALKERTEYAEQSMQWDINGFVLPQKSTKDKTVVYQYDALLQMTAKILKQVSYQKLDPTKRTATTHIGDLTTLYRYDALGNLIQTTDARGNTSYCYYNEIGQLIATTSSKTQQGRGATTYSYDGLGNLVATKIWALGVDESDLEHFTLRGASMKDIGTYSEYNTDGQKISETDGMGHTIQFSYDANGNVARQFYETTQVDGSKLIHDTRYHYNSEHRLTQTLTYKNNGSCKTEDVRYTLFGEVADKGVNGIYTTHADYDVMGRVWRSNTAGYYQIFVYDLAGHVTQVVSATNTFRPDTRESGIDLSQSIFETATQYASGEWLYDLGRQDNIYDALGHLMMQRKESTLIVETQNHAPILQTIIQSQSVDRWGNMLRFINARGYETRYEYNALNEVVSQQLPEVWSVDAHGVGHNIHPTHYYAYDELGQIIAMTDANGHTVTKEYDALGRVIQETDAKGYTRKKSYSLLNQLETLANELGAVTHYTYDKANRLIAVQTPKTTQSYIYDESGGLIKQVNGANEETRFWYDTSGNQIKRQSGKKQEIRYEYDDKNCKVKESDAQGHQQTWTFDDAGRLVRHSDLGGHETRYEYNVNGLILSEASPNGKHIEYHYRGDGLLSQYDDKATDEVINYEYDEEGNTVFKGSSKGGSRAQAWLRELDYYQYDGLGRLIHIRRRRPEDTDIYAPDKDNALLSVDYEYDAADNIRHTLVRANYTGYQQVSNEDYFLYDENNRMLLNKGQLVNDEIVATKGQGSRMTYDAAGNIATATRMEYDALQHYRYQYTEDNQLEVIQKNGITLETKMYDEAGRVIQEHLFDGLGNIAEQHIMTFEDGAVAAQSMRNRWGAEVSKTLYQYDAAGNMLEYSTRTNAVGKSPGSSISHHYCYTLGEGYEQSVDDATLSVDGYQTTYGKNTRVYDVNGQLSQTIDTPSGGNGQHATSYWVSAIEGIKGREDSSGQVNYLSVAGKTLGDLWLEQTGLQHLNIYGGFTPSGSQQKASNIDSLHAAFTSGTYASLQKFLGRAAPGVADGTLPEATQNNLGSYTLQAYDTLESVAFQIYGDSSLWYVIADANGVSDRNARAGSAGGLQVGQRLNIPALARSAHHSSKTRAVLNSSQMLGNISATTPIPMPPASPMKHHSLIASIVVAVACIAATIFTAGLIGVIAGVSGGSSSLFAIGAGVLKGASFGLAGTMAAGFSAGFVGSLSSQGIANALNMQKGIDFKSALISGLTLAATSGIFKALGGTKAYTDLVQKADGLSINEHFSIKSAAEMMGQDVLSQGIELGLGKSQQFSWEELAARGATAGLLASVKGTKLTQKLNRLDYNTNIITSELEALASNGLTSAATGSQWSAKEVLTNHLGSAIGEAVVSKEVTREIESIQDEIQSETINQLPYPEALYLSDNLLNIIHPERALELAYQKYLVSKLDEGLGYEGRAETYEFCPIPESEAEYSHESCPIPELEAEYSQIPEGFYNNAKPVDNSWHIGTRLNGLVDFTFGMGQAIGLSAVAAGTEGTLLGVVAGGILHGLDNASAGLAKILTGKESKTLTEKALQTLGVSEQNASYINTGALITRGFGLPKYALSKLGTHANIESYYLTKTSIKLGAKKLIADPRTTFFAGAVTNMVYGAAFGAYGAAVVNEGKTDIIIGAGIGALVGLGMELFPKTLLSATIAGIGADVGGQLAAKIVEKDFTLQFNGLSILGSALGAGWAFRLTQYAPPISAAIIGTMPETLVGILGYKLGKKENEKK
jgi:YD repeat-containing protein